MDEIEVSKVSKKHFRQCCMVSTSRLFQTRLGGVVRTSSECENNVLREQWTQRELAGAEGKSEENEKMEVDE